jgi:hypothetical protein
MRIWIGLLLAPVLALTDQSVAYALVGWACAHQTMAPVHAAHLLFLALTTGACALSWRAWRETAVIPANEGDAVLQRHFLAGVATSVAALSAVAVVAMWIATWMISSCTA